MTSMELNDEQVQFLKEQRDGRLRELDAEIDQYARTVLEDVNLKLTSKYRQIEINMSRADVNFGLYIERLSNKINYRLKPHLYCYWDKTYHIGYERIFHLFLGLYYRENQWGCSIPFDIALKVMKSLDGYDGDIELYDENFIEICKGDFSDWLKRNETLDKRVIYTYIGKYLKPEDYKGMELDDLIFNNLSFFIDKLTPLLIEESKAMK